MAKRKRRVRQAEIVRRFAERLRELRQARGMTQRQLADKAHVSLTYISKLEAAGAAPGIDLLQRLATSLGVAVTDLLPAAAALEPDVLREQLRELFETVLGLAGQDTLLMLRLFLERLAEATSTHR